MKTKIRIENLPINTGQRSATNHDRNTPMNEEFVRRKTPRKGTVVRIQLDDGYYYYICVVTSCTQWLYGFRTKVPAHGSKFFDRSYWKWGADLSIFSEKFVNCGFIKLEGLPYTYTPTLYELISKEEAAYRGYRYNTVIPKSWDTAEMREVTPEEIEKHGYGRFHQYLMHDHAKVITPYIPQMEEREVPRQFVDKRTAEEMRSVKKSTTLTVCITFQQHDLETDDPEPDIEHPLTEAIEDADCGSFASSGTEPGGLFSIDYITTRAKRAKCLRVIERTLKKLGCPASTTVEVLEA
jgi:hypothetical protein